MFRRKLILLCAILCVSGCSSVQKVNKITKMGSMFTPRNFPNSTGDDVTNYFELSKQMGNHISLLLQWSEADDLTFARQLQNGAQIYDLKFHLTLSPISVLPQRDRVNPPSGVSGNSFGDSSIRKAFKAKALELADMHPDVLGIGSEANLLASNASEFKHFVSLTREVYSSIKAIYPDQIVSISFAYDIEKLKLKPYYVPGSIIAFKDSLDIYAFTSYPFVFSSSISDDYYSMMMDYGKVSIEEIGVSSKELGATRQAKFYSRFPVLFRSAEYITLFKMHDFSVGVGDRFESIGVRKNSGFPKKSWKAVKNLRWAR